MVAEPYLNEQESNMSMILNEKFDIPKKNSTGPIDALALNWLEGHMRIMNFWLDRLVSENGDESLIDTLHRQSCWLQQMTERISRGR